MMECNLLGVTMVNSQWQTEHYQDLNELLHIQAVLTPLLTGEPG